MKKPIGIEVGEWYFKGCFIQEQQHYMLDKYVVFKDNQDQDHIGTASSMAMAKKLCIENEVTEPHLGLKSFGIVEPLPKKYKEYNLGIYYRGVELRVHCVTTSTKKFAELIDKSPIYVKDYSSGIEPKTKECIDNIDVVYALPGWGGEAWEIFTKDGMKLYSEYKTLIDEHRKKFPMRHDWEEHKKTLTKN
jgi:hypothetical protein